MSALKEQIGGSHYKNFEYQPIQLFLDLDLNFIQCNIIKYIVRHKFKNGVEDVKKAKHYAEIALENGAPCHMLSEDDKDLIDIFINQLRGDEFIEKGIIILAIYGRYRDVIDCCYSIIREYEH